MYPYKYKIFKPVEDFFEIDTILVILLEFKISWDTLDNIVADLYHYAIDIFLQNVKIVFDRFWEFVFGWLIYCDGSIIKKFFARVS